ncbi:hypothetical protein CP532_2741 [Ophiocordyceps camponoti-leonardi (nom. inval.)]|nr:hypothetical protein CP532_2741 [Ophiocordyceps camponoti-leonardi (nom. inval.)]
MKTALICVAGLVVAAAAAAGDRPVSAPGLVPRYGYPDHVPRPVPAPRHGPVRRAIGDGFCRRGSHNCLDIGHADQCCDDESYCYVNRKYEPRCCPVGSNCVDDSPCKSDSFFCSKPADRLGCCGRLCPQTSHYLCPQSLGGRCCPYGAQCQSGGNCLQTKTSMMTTTTATTNPTAAGSGCSSQQYDCSDGTGCCGLSQLCARVSETAYCTPVDRGLSRGALAGIGVSAAVAISVVIGAAVWVCLSCRRRDKDELRITSTSPRHGLTEDYSGPNPVSGPYTESAVPSATRLLGGLPRAVPTRPDGPGDIAAPVEMDSEERRR